MLNNTPSAKNGNLHISKLLHSMLSVELIITVLPLQTFVLFCFKCDEASHHESEQPSSLLASANREQLANHKAVGCFKAEPWLELVGEGEEPEQ